MRRPTALPDSVFVEGTPPRLVGGRSRHTGEISYPLRSSDSDPDERVEIEGAGTLNAPLVDWENAQLRKGARVALVIGEVKRDASGNVFVGPRFRPS
jgi:uncharacterized OB-fold protein